MDRQTLFAYAQGQFDTIPDYPWKKFPNHAVLRHSNNKKWYGLVINISSEKLGLHSTKRIDILNVKVNPEYSYFLQQRPDIFSAYHMNREHWVSILFQGRIPNDEIFRLLEQSFKLTQ